MLLSSIGTLSFFLQLFFVFPALDLLSSPSAPSLAAPYAYLYDPERDLILFERKADHLIAPSSMTKLPLALFALQKNEDLQEQILVPFFCFQTVKKEDKIKKNYSLAPYFLEPDAVVVPLKGGDTLSLEELLHYTLILSANDAATLLALHLGSLEEAMLDLNHYLREIGCSSTLFLNPTGLDYPQHRTTLRDLALIMKECLKEKRMMDILQKEQISPLRSLPHQGGWNTNQLVVEKSPYFYPYCLGGKTGYTANAGHCLVSAAKKGNRTLIAILAKESKRSQLFIDAIQLFDWGFAEEAETKKLFCKEDPCFKHSIEAISIPACLTEDCIVSYYPSEEKDLRISLVWDPITLPLNQGEKIGELVVFNEKGKAIHRQPLVSHQRIEKKGHRHLFLWGFVGIVLFAFYYSIRKGSYLSGRGK